MNLNQRMTILETKIRYMEKAIYLILVIVLADLGITII